MNNKNISILRFLSLFILLLPVAPLQAAEEAASGGHLFILSGQSNMTGGLKSAFTATVVEALGEDRVTVASRSRPGRGIRFWVEDYALPGQHKMDEKLNKKTSNGEEFPRLLNAVRKVARDADTYDTVSFIWMQGESDAMRSLGVAYERSFKVLTERLKEELGIEEMYFVIGRISDHGLYGKGAEGWKEMRAVQQKLAEDDPMGTWIDTDDLNGGNEEKPGGDLHYPKDQVSALGQRFARAALAQLGVKQSAACCK